MVTKGDKEVGGPEKGPKKGDVICECSLKLACKTHILNIVDYVIRDFYAKHHQPLFIYIDTLHL